MIARQRRPKTPDHTGKTAYLNARVVDPASGLDAKGGVLVDGEAIADVGAGLFANGVPSGVEVIDCRGAVLAPGLIDIRVNLREPGEEHKETFETACAAAALGGITSMVCLPDTAPPIDDVALIEFVARRAREVRGARIYPYGAVTRGLKGAEIVEMGLMSLAGAVAFTDGTRAVADAVVMRRALNYARTFDALIVQHPEEPALAADGDMNEGEVATRLGLAGIPACAETIMLERDLALVALTGGRYHAAHISTRGGVECIRRAKDQGLQVTCDTAPHYFTLNETAVGDYRTFAKVSPPLRSEDDRTAIEEGLRDGTIDVIASDHAPHDQDSKRLPFPQAECGIVGLESLLALSLRLHHQNGMKLIDVLAQLTARPAEILGLPGGRLAKGAPADLAIFDPSRPWRLDPDSFHSKSKNSPFDGHPVQGRVLMTVVGGRCLYELAAEPAR